MGGSQHPNAIQSGLRASDDVPSVVGTEGRPARFEADAAEPVAARPTASRATQLERRRLDLLTTLILLSGFTLFFGLLFAPGL